MKVDGTLHSVDQFLNLKVEGISVHELDQYPHMVRTYVCLIFSLMLVSLV
jgi:small nuclear ribonucleoprotein (snRNP)-like protein